MRTWIHETVNVTGPIEQTHIQVWGTVARVPTDQGVVWFKASGDAHNFEPHLIALLSRFASERVPALVATDDQRKWWMTRDAGTRLRDLISTPLDIGLWEEYLPEYSEIQIGAVDHVTEILAIGVPDESLSGLPGRIARILSNHEYLMLSRPDGLSIEDLRAMERALPELESQCDWLTSCGIPETIQHDDLNDGNVFVDQNRYRTMDWGDACISHPFHTLTVLLRATAFRLDLEPGGAELTRMRDAYLEPFQSFSDRKTLAAASEIAYRTGTLARVHAWYRYMEDRAPEDRDEDREAIPYGIKRYLAAEPFGSWRD